MAKKIEPKLSISVTLKGKATTSTLPFKVVEEIKNKILGKSYELSVVFVGTSLAKKINMERRKKSYTPNTLSFAYDKNLGEIIVCPMVVKKQALQNKAKYPDYLAFILIHSMLHLKGMEHGDQMDKLELKYLKLFGYKI